MKPILGTYKYLIDAYLADFRGKATLPMIGGFMLQSATRHAEERGFGYNEMTGQQRAWVLSRMVIEMIEFPLNDNVFVINTWVADVNKLFTERYFSFENEKGEKLGYAKSLWASIDLTTRRPTNVQNLSELVAYIDKEQPCPIEGLNKIPLLKEDYDHAGSFDVKYSDVDINKHLNSMKYIEHFIDIFDIDMFKEKEIRRFQINYIAEAHYGTHIDFLKKEIEKDIFVIEMKTNETTVCTSRITWK